MSWVLACFIAWRTAVPVGVFETRQLCEQARLIAYAAVPPWRTAEITCACREASHADR